MTDFFQRTEQHFRFTWEALVSNRLAIHLLSSGSAMYDMVLRQYLHYYQNYDVTDFRPLPHRVGRIGNRPTHVPSVGLTAPDLYLNEAFLITRTKGRTGDIPVGEISRPQAVNVVVIEQSLGSWSHLWSLSNVSGRGSTSLFGSHAGTHQIRDQSRTLEDRNNSNNSFRGVHT